jgi:hypothetical protein
VALWRAQSCASVPDLSKVARPNLKHKRASAIFATEIAFRSIDEKPQTKLARARFSPPLRERMQRSTTEQAKTLRALWQPDELPLWTVRQDEAELENQVYSASRVLRHQTFILNF